MHQNHQAGKEVSDKYLNRLPDRDGWDSVDRRSPQNGTDNKQTHAGGILGYRKWHLTWITPANAALLTRAYQEEEPGRANRPHSHQTRPPPPGICVH